MKQIKVFNEMDVDSLECHVNDFIKEHPNVVDIQFRIMKSSCFHHYIAMIIYEDGERC